MSTATARAATVNPSVERPELDLRELAGVPAGRMLRAIARNCVAVRISCHGLGAERKLDDPVVTVGDQRLPDELLAGARARIVPKEIHLAIDRVARRARDLPKGHGTPFVGGAYLVPTVAPAGGARSAAERMFEQLAAVRNEYRETAEQMRGTWETHVETMRRTQAALYEMAERWFVDGATFVAKHTLSAALFPLGGGLPADFSRTVEEEVRRLQTDPGVSPEDAEAARRLAPRLAALVAEAADRAGRPLGEGETAAWAAEARRATSEMIARTVADMCQEPLTEFAQALSAVEGIVSREGNLRENSLQNVRDAHEKLQGFSFLLDADLASRVNAVGARIRNLSPQDVNGTANRMAAENLAGVFRTIREEVTAEDTHRRTFGQFARRVLY